MFTCHEAVRISRNNGTEDEADKSKGIRMSNKD